MRQESEGIVARGSLWYLAMNRMGRVLPLNDEGNTHLDELRAVLDQVVRPRSRSASRPAMPRVTVIGVIDEQDDHDEHADAPAFCCAS